MRCMLTLSTSMPLMRALVLDYQDDENTYEIGDQYLFGDAMMICPVTTKGAQSRTVYLPKGEWIDYWTGKKYEGNQYFSTLTPLDSLPIFVKAGSIIPMQEKMGYVGEKRVEKIMLDIFPGANSSFELYEDDGRTLSYKEGNYALTKISLTAKEAINISIGKPEGKFQPVIHQFIVRLHADKKPTSVFENGASLNASNENAGSADPSWYFNANEKVVYVKPSKGKQVSIEIKF